MVSQEETINISLYLHKEEVKSFDDCVKSNLRDTLQKYEVKKSVGMSGKIYVHSTVKKPPKWYGQLNKLSKDNVEIDENASNKAIVVFKHRKRYFSITYGYGKSILDDSTIVRNFGLITSVNLIDAEKIKSLNSMSIEDVIIDTQKQSSSTSSQDKLQIDRFKEILKSVSGSPSDENVAKFLVGSDSLNFTKKMDIKNIKDNIKYLYRAYRSNNYKNNGFGWLDNIKKVKDKSTTDLLNQKLCEDILNSNGIMSIAPNRILNWEEINGFYLTGMGSNKEFSFNINSEKYLKFISDKYKEKEFDVLAKLKRDKLIGVHSEDDDKVIANVYQSLIYECEFNGEVFIFTFGEWFEIKPDYYTYVTDFIDNIPECGLSLPSHIKKLNETETKFNKRVVDADPNLSLLDMKNYSPQEYSHSKVEPCDIISKNHQLIHVKKGGKSSELSHLFSQAIVSCNILANDDRLREHINKEVKTKFGSNFIPNNYSNAHLEIVFAIITEKNYASLSGYLPFFSRVNLMQAVNNLKSLEFKYSMMIIKSS